MFLKLAIVAVILCCFIKNTCCINEVCDSDDDCNTMNQERCQRIEKCKKGRCVCPRGFVEFPETGVCGTVKAVGAACTTSYECGQFATCTGNPNKCTCSSGITAADAVNCDAIIHTVGGDCTTKPCNEFLGLQCTTSKKCECRDGSVVRSDVYTKWPTQIHVTGCVHPRSRSGIGEGKRCTGRLLPGAIAGRPALLCQQGLECAMCPEDKERSNDKDFICVKTSFSRAGFTANSSMLTVFFLFVVVCLSNL